MACEPAFPDLEDLYGLREEILRLVEEHMSEACADNGADEKVDQQGIQLACRIVLPLADPGHDPVAEQKSGHEQQAVPVYRYRAKADEDSIRIPVKNHVWLLYDAGNRMSQF